MEWTVHPLRRDTGKSILLILVICLVSLLVYAGAANGIGTGNKLEPVAITVVLTLLLVGYLRQYFFPTRYLFSEEGIRITTFFGTVNKRWEAFKSFYPDTNGVLLSPFAEKTRLENFRGVYILFNNNAPEVMEFVRKKISPAGQQ